MWGDEEKQTLSKEDSDTSNITRYWRYLSITLLRSLENIKTTNNTVVMVINGIGFNAVNKCLWIEVER